MLSFLRRLLPKANYVTSEPKSWPGFLFFNILRKRSKNIQTSSNWHHQQLKEAPYQCESCKADKYIMSNFNLILHWQSADRMTGLFTHLKWCVIQSSEHNGEQLPFMLQTKIQELLNYWALEVLATANHMNNLTKWQLCVLIKMQMNVLASFVDVQYY